MVMTILDPNHELLQPYVGVSLILKLILFPCHLEASKIKIPLGKVQPYQQHVKPSTLVSMSLRLREMMEARLMTDMLVLQATCL